MAWFHVTLHVSNMLYYQALLVYIFFIFKQCIQQIMWLVHFCQGQDQMIPRRSNRGSMESWILPDCVKKISFLPVPVCAVPDYSIDMPPFTLYGSRAKQTKSIAEFTHTHTHTVTKRPEHMHWTEREREER